MLRILHIIDKMGGAGRDRCLIAAAKYATQAGIVQQHRVITLQPKAYPLSLIAAKQVGISVIRQPDRETLLREITQADIVQVHFWNHPALYDLLRSELPAMRLLIWFAVSGHQAPQAIPTALVDRADFALASSPCTLNLPTLQQNKQKADFVYSLADWDRLADLQPRAHTGFNVGYIGTINFAKMHPWYVPMSAAIQVPGIQFIVCGGGIQAKLHQQALELGAAEKFDFRGYVENIKPVLEMLDVFGYPLCSETYATSEKSLQEAMYAGVPPVVFPYGGVRDLVQHEQTGLVVESEAEYQQAIKYLYHHPEVRFQLGQNAAQYAREVFDSKAAVRKLNQIYHQMMQAPKQQKAWKDQINLTTAAHCFSETLADTAPEFNLSLTATNSQIQLQAEATIAAASEALAQGEGGVIHYRNTYPEDGYLRLWSGLVLQYQEKHSEALFEFSAAIDLGCNHWRVWWYLAQSALQVRNNLIAREALTQVIAAAPEFVQAQQLFRIITGQVLVAVDK